MFGPVLPALSKDRQVIAVDLHGHGRTALGDRDIDLVAIGDDLAAVVKQLGYDKVDVLGYSFGGGAAFRLRRAASRRRCAGWRWFRPAIPTTASIPDMRAQQVQLSAAAAEFMKDTPMYKSYVAVAPKPEDFPKLLEQMGRLHAQAL